LAGKYFGGKILWRENTFDWFLKYSFKNSGALFTTLFSSKLTTGPNKQKCLVFVPAKPFQPYKMLQGLLG